MRTETNDTRPGTADVVREMERPAARNQRDDGNHHVPLLSEELHERLRTEWVGVQASFVDEPREAVQRADELVAFAIKQIAETFARERSGLEAQWDREGEVSTEDLRVALTKYRSFFHRLLSM